MGHSLAIPTTPAVSSHSILASPPSTCLTVPSHLVSADSGRTYLKLRFKTMQDKLSVSLSRIEASRPCLKREGRKLNSNNQSHLGLTREWKSASGSARYLKTNKWLRRLLKLKRSRSQYTSTMKGLRMISELLMMQSLERRALSRMPLA